MADLRPYGRAYRVPLVIDDRTVRIVGQYYLLLVLCPVEMQFECRHGGGGGGGGGGRGGGRRFSQPGWHHHVLSFVRHNTEVLSRGEELFI